MKRLIVCCDGTWLDSTSGLMSGELPIPSNVTRIARAIKPVSRDGVPQVVYYQAGIGSQGKLFHRILGGATAEGLVENIRAGYTFLADNYHEGDQIFLFGFSRGAFTVRSIAGFIDGVGLLTKDGLPYTAEVFKDWENAYNDRYTPKHPDLPFRNKPSASDPEYKRVLYQKGLSNLNVPIQAVGVWDTVGSLGIPRLPIFERMGLHSRSTKEFLFYDTKLNDHIVNAFQALALDEHRSAFQPAVWEKPKGNQTNLRQVWFPGAHSNVGGGSYHDAGVSNITLAWMIAQVETMIDFDTDYVMEQHELNSDYYEESGQKIRPWSFGKIYRSFTGIYVLGGRTSRKPGDYFETDPMTNQETDRPLRDTNEYIHACCRARKVKKGPGVEDVGTWDAHPLGGYRVRPPNYDGPAMWEPRSRRSGLHALPEAPLWGIEKELLADDARMEEFLKAPAPRGSSSQLVRRSRSRRDNMSPISNGMSRDSER